MIFFKILQNDLLVSQNVYLGPQKFCYYDQSTIAIADLGVGRLSS